MWVLSLLVFAVLSTESIPVNTVDQITERVSFRLMPKFKFFYLVNDISDFFAYVLKESMKSRKQNTNVRGKAF